MYTPGISFLSGLHPTFNSGSVVGSHTGFQVTYMWNTSSWCRTLVWNPTPPPTILIWPPFQFHLLGFFSMLLFFRFLSPPSFLAPSHHSYLSKSMIFWKPFLGLVFNSRGDFGLNSNHGTSSATAHEPIQACQALSGNCQAGAILASGSIRFYVRKFFPCSFFFDRLSPLVV